MLEWSLARFEAPLLAGQLVLAEGEDGEVARLNADFLATRETSELRAETVQMGWSLVKLLAELEAFASIPGWRVRLLAIDTPCFPTVWSAAAAAWQVPPDQALAAYLWAWAENQVMAAVKAVPLGQMPVSACWPDSASASRPWSNSRCVCPRRAGATTPRPGDRQQPHETQYTRLFRS